MRSLKVSFFILFFVFIDVSAIARNASDSIAGRKLYIAGDSLMIASKHNESIEHFRKAAALFRKAQMHKRYLNRLNKFSENFRRCGKLD